MGLDFGLDIYIAFIISVSEDDITPIGCMTCMSKIMTFYGETGIQEFLWSYDHIYASVLFSLLNSLRNIKKVKNLHLIYFPQII